ncbi:MAG: CPBP family intramembrane metalloprotease [Cyclobacteriaceae bacterium]|nr:CPBP family intramembrane metalloprotease [Cyclobacteriaceae bacterium]
MGNIENDLMLSRHQKPWLSLLSVILLAIGGLLVGQSIGMGIVAYAYDLGLEEILSGITGLSEDFKIPIYIIQGFSALFAFILAPLFYLYVMEKKGVSILSPLSIKSAMPLLLAVLIAIVFIPVSFKVMEWNTQLSLGEWATEQEENLEEVTRLLTNMDGFGQFLLAMLVIAIVPAVGEELLFRGLIQNKLQAWTLNAHVAIWLTAIMFSAMHLQFYGFIPRMLLGALFGYLYFWSGNLILPIVAHFVNNGFQLIMLYIYQSRLTELNIDEVEQVPWPVFITTSLIALALIYYFRRHFNERHPASHKWQRVFSTDKTHQAEIVKAVLDDNHLDPVIINKKDSAYDRFGDIEVHVIHENVMRARQIIDNEINFE